MSFQEYTLDLEPLFYSPMDNVDFNDRVEEIINFTTSEPTEATVEDNSPIPAAEFCLKLAHNDVNLVNDSSFESGETPSSTVEFSAIWSATVDVVDTEFHDGDYSLEVVSNDTASGGGGIAMVAPIGNHLDNGSRFFVSAWVKGPIGESIVIAPIAYTDDNTRILSPFGAATTSFDFTGNWQRISTEITYTDDTEESWRPGLDIRLSEVSGSTYYIDAVEVEEGTELTAYTPDSTPVVFNTTIGASVAIGIVIKPDDNTVRTRPIFRSNDLDIDHRYDGTNAYIVVDGTQGNALDPSNWYLIIYNNGVWRTEIIDEDLTSGLFACHVFTYDAALTTAQEDDFVELVKNGYTIETINEGATLQLTDTGATGLAADWHIISV